MIYLQIYNKLREKLQRGWKIGLYGYSTLNRIYKYINISLLLTFSIIIDNI